MSLAAAIARRFRTRRFAFAFEFVRFALVAVPCAANTGCARSNGHTAGDSSATFGLELADAELADAQTDAGPRNRGDAGRLGAASFHTSVIDVPEWPESDGGAMRLGYLRHGAVVTAYDARLVNEECTDGWYELVEGGFVCGKAVTFDLASPRVRLSPRQPDQDAGMPYRYGVNLVDGTPLYRRVLKNDDRKKYEGEPEPKAEPKVDPKAEARNEAKTEEPAAEEEVDAGPPRKGAIVDAGAADAALDAGKPRLKDLKGRGVLVRKMVRGFYLALDRDFKAANAHWWRTTYGFAVPFERLAVQTKAHTSYSGRWFGGAPTLDGGTDAMAHGSDDAGDASSTNDASDVHDADTIDGGAAFTASVAFVTTESAHELRMSGEGAKAKIGWGPELPKRRPVLLTGGTFTQAGATYHETSEGFFIRLSDVFVAKPAPPMDLAPNEKWIDVDLTRQTLVAFEGMRPVFGTLISSGRRNATDKERDFPTPTGTFRIREKHVTTTMDGDVASDGPYSIEDVPWVMYFQGSYALHGAFWHDAFGHVRSHGCVNLAPDDARTILGWSDPPLPTGWHGVFSKGADDGTRIVVHEDPPKKPDRRR